MCSQTFKPIRENYAYATNDTAIFKLAKQMDISISMAEKKITRLKPSLFALLLPILLSDGDKAPPPRDTRSISHY